MDYAPVKSKRDFVRRYKAGEFGNRSPTWNTLEEWGEAEYCGHVHIRNRVAGGPTYYNLCHFEVKDAWNYAIGEGGATPDSLYISAMAPHEHNLIQGEVFQDPFGRGTRLFYSMLPGYPMRDALRITGLPAFGIMAVSLLRMHMNPVSYDWLNILLERYPGHVVEFSTFDIQWGTLPRFNTVFWEVRDY